MTDTCPLCGADLTGEPIPPESREHFGGHAHGSRRIAIYDPGRDRTVAWQCPDCGGQWDRETGCVIRKDTPHD